MEKKVCMLSCLSNMNLLRYDYLDMILNRNKEEFLFFDIFFLCKHNCFINELWWTLTSIKIFFWKSLHLTKYKLENNTDNKIDRYSNNNETKGKRNKLSNQLSFTVNTSTLPFRWNLLNHN